MDSVKCEVLNASYEQLNIVSLRKAIKMVVKGKADILAEHPDKELLTVNDMYPVPSQIRLRYMVKNRPNGPAQLTQRNLFTRDKWECQYCGRHKSELKPGEILTRDHVFPKTKGGKDTWTNVLTACVTCNNKKADYTLDQIDMPPLKTPTVPNLFELWSKSDSRIRRVS